MISSSRFPQPASINIHVQLFPLFAALVALATVFLLFRRSDWSLRVSPCWDGSLSSARHQASWNFSAELFEDAHERRSTIPTDLDSRSSPPPRSRLHGGMPVKEFVTLDPDHFLFRKVILRFYVTSSTYSCPLVFQSWYCYCFGDWRPSSEIKSQINCEKDDHTMLRWTRARPRVLFSTTISSSVVGIFKGSCVFAFWRFSKIEN